MPAEGGARRRRCCRRRCHPFLGPTLFSARVRGKLTDDSHDGETVTVAVDGVESALIFATLDSCYFGSTYSSIQVMKVSISLPEEDVEFLDEYRDAIGASSRSAVLQKAVRLLRATALGPAYSSAWDEWDGQGEAEVWEAVVDDGMGERGR